jgi:acyl-CoA thioesterase II
VWAPVEARGTAIHGGSVPSMRRWLRWSAPLPADPRVHAAALVWMSDRPMLRTARLPVASQEIWAMPGASLDHAFWLHRPARADDWLLLEVSSPVRAGARSLSEARIFHRDGRLVATSTQECLVR